MKITTKQLTVTALLLAICICSQYFKNFSVYVTGPIVNVTIILATLGAGLFSGILISVIAPITAFFFTGSPIMAAIPLMFPVVMVGNVIMAVSVYLCEKKIKLGKSYRNTVKLPVGLAVGSVLKAAFMGSTVVFVIFPLFGGWVADKLVKPELLPEVLDKAKALFSITQLITALIGSIIAYLIWIPLKKYLIIGDK